VPNDASRAVVENLFSPRSNACISIDGQDPPERLMRDIQVKYPHVYPASKCTKGDMMYLTPLGKRTNATGLFGWRRISPWHAKLKVFEDSNFMFGSSESTISLKLVNGHWIVTEYSGESIS
jgi:hypothetical protein